MSFRLAAAGFILFTGLVLQAQTAHGADQVIDGWDKIHFGMTELYYHSKIESQYQHDQRYAPIVAPLITSIDGMIFRIRPYFLETKPGQSVVNTISLLIDYQPGTNNACPFEQVLSGLSSKYGRAVQERVARDAPGDQAVTWVDTITWGEEPRTVKLRFDASRPPNCYLEIVYNDSSIRVPDPEMPHPPNSPY